MSISLVGGPEALYGDPEEERKEPRPKVPADKPMDGSMAKSEISRVLSLITNRANSIVGCPTRYKPAEFGEEADGLYDLVSHYAALRVVLRLLSPIAAVLALWEKAEDTLASVRARRQQKAEQAPSVEQAPTVEEVSGKRAKGFGRA